MIFLYVILILIVISIIYMRFETTLLRVKHVSFSKGSGLKILQLSDIHINYLKVPVKKIKSAIEKENPDLIVLTGDYIYGRKDIPDFLRFLDDIKSSIRMLACLGNHDYEAFLGNPSGLNEFIKNISKKGVQVLTDDSIVYEKAGKKYNLVGIADKRRGSPDFGKAFRNLNPEPSMTIGISHNPDIVLDIPEKKLDYLFCGHFHGGQIWAPFDFEFKVLRKERLCKMGIRRGLHKVNGINLYINAGLGNVWFPLRFLSVPEITVFNLP